LIFADNRAIFVFPVKVVKGNNKLQVVVENLTAKQALIQTNYPKAVC
jgi:hypothetical protein